MQDVQLHGTLIAVLDGGAPPDVQDCFVHPAFLTAAALQLSPPAPRNQDEPPAPLKCSSSGPLGGQPVNLSDGGI